MRIIIVGAGNIGSKIARQVEAEQVECGAAFQRKTGTKRRMPLEHSQEIEQVDYLLQHLRPEAGRFGFGHQTFSRKSYVSPSHARVRTCSGTIRFHPVTICPELPRSM